MYSILIVDDELSVRESLRFLLEQGGYQVYLAETGPQGLAAARSLSPDLVLLDVQLPGMDGFEVCRQLRAEGFAPPVLMLTARDQELDSVLGLELGADDYVTKPFRHRELQARIKAHLRRTGRSGEGCLRGAGLELYPERRQVQREGRDLELTPREFDLLRMLMENANRVVSRERLLESVWGYDYEGEARVVKVTMARLREKLDLEADPIVTVRGVGYRFEA